VRSGGKDNGNRKNKPLSIYKKKKKEEGRV
jgi:hypothetical protein